MKDLRLMSNALTVVSTLTAEQVETVAKQDPEALMLFSGEGNDRYAEFAVTYDKKRAYGTVENNGINFPGTDKDGHLLVTVLIPANVAAEDYVYDKYAVALAQLANVEQKVVESLKTTSKTKAEFIKTITRVDAEAGEKVNPKK